MTVQIIIPIVVAFCIVMICVIAYIMWRRRQIAKKHQNQFPLEERNPPQDVVNELEPMLPVLPDGTDEVNG